MKFIRNDPPFKIFFSTETMNCCLENGKEILSISLECVEFVNGIYIFIKTMGSLLKLYRFLQEKFALDLCFLCLNEFFASFMNFMLLF